MTQDKLNFTIPEGLHKLLANHLRLANEQQSYINALVSGFLSDKNIPQNATVELSADGKEIIVKLAEKE